MQIFDLGRRNSRAYTAHVFFIITKSDDALLRKWVRSLVHARMLPQMIYALIMPWRTILSLIKLTCLF